MKDVIKKIISAPVLSLVLLLLFSSVNATGAMSHENTEENANMVRASDRIITGRMDEFSKRGIVVNNTGYRLCNGVRVFSRLNTIIPLSDLDSAEDVRLFKSRGCIRKIKVLTFAQ
ncbi:MAG: hypothetical protein GXP46_13840 [Deferribacteres bacterium]|nr:hypothetical protein [Deferribacteres bacterium]